MQRFIHLARVVIFGTVLSSSTNFAQPIPGQYIAVLKEDITNPADAAQQLGNQHGVNVGYVYQHSIRGFAFAGNERAVQALAGNPRIAFVEPDQVYQAWQAAVPTGLRRIGIDENILSHISPDGQDVDARIAILDTGIQPDHPDLNVDPSGVRFFLRGNKVFSDSDSNDNNGHGTHVAGIAGGNGGIVGVAPGALLTAVKVLDENGSGSLSTIMAGIDWVVANAAKFDVANMSLGGGFSQALNDAVRKGTEVGIVFCVAAGNMGRDVKDGSPASEPSAITVSAMTDFDGGPGGQSTAGSSDCTLDDFFACWSNFGPGVDICAPGVLIKSTWNNGGYNTISGTSMAAPHVAGAAALYIATHRQTVSALPLPERVPYVTQAVLDSGWGSGDFGYYDGDKDGFAEPLLNASSLLGLTTRPQIAVSITLPTTDAAFDPGQPITFDASGSSSDLSSALFWRWTSSLDGLIGTAESFSTTSLSQGVHTIAASLTQLDSWFSGFASISITVGTPPPPRQLVLTVTTDKAVYLHGETMFASHHVTDAADGSNIAGASVDSTLTDANGNQYFIIDAVTDADGLMVAAFRIDVRRSGIGTYTISAAADKTGCLGAQASTSFVAKRK